MGLSRANRLVIVLQEIEFGRMIRYRVAHRLNEIGMKVTMVDKDLGYELRCADPIPFDAEYTRNLGYGAVKFLHSFSVMAKQVFGPLTHKCNPEVDRRVSVHPA